MARKITPLTKILCRSGLDKVTTSTNIRKSFLQVKVLGKDIHPLCFMWWADNYMYTLLVENGMTSHTFAAVCLLCCGNYPLSGIAAIHGEPNIRPIVTTVNSNYYATDYFGLFVRWIRLKYTWCGWWK